MTLSRHGTVKFNVIYVPIAPCETTLQSIYLEAQINKSHLEMEHIRLQITKTKKEIQLLDHQLKVGDVPTGGCFLIVSTTKD